MPAANDLRRVLRRAGWRPRAILRGFWVRLRAAARRVRSFRHRGTDIQVNCARDGGWARRCIRLGAIKIDQIARSGCGNWSMNCAPGLLSVRLPAADQVALTGPRPCCCWGKSHYGSGVDATTCAPCARAMPLMIAVTSRSSCLR